MRGHVLLVDDDADMRDALVAGLDEEGFDVLGAESGERALELLRLRPVEALVTDIRMKGMDGLALCERAKQIKPKVPAIVMTGFGDMEAAVAAIRAGAYDFLAKPFDTEVLTIALDRAVQNCRLNAELGLLQRRLREIQPFEEILGESREIKDLCSLLERAAQTHSTVLITGETGSGKELVARALHRRGPRAEAPFVAINCAAVPESLLESELFGHARGAFTDAKASRQGLLQKAQGGTLFLDEIGDMPLVLQAKLLRVLQERKIRPVGSDEEVGVDVRVVAATHCDLEVAVGAGSFREDLLYRINVIQLSVPPLRARGNDILLLSQAFLSEHARRSGRPVKGISSDAAAKLLAYDWPGNVRELQNCMERAVALTLHDKIVVEDLAPKVLAWDPTQASSASGVELIPLEQVERRHIMAVLEAVDGNKARAATILRIGRKTLYRRLEAYQAE